MGGGGVIVKSDVRIQLDRSYPFLNNTGKSIKDVYDLHYKPGYSDVQQKVNFSYSFIYNGVTQHIYLSSNKLHLGYYTFIKFSYNDREYTINLLNDGVGYFRMTISPDDLKIKEITVNSRQGHEKVLEISRNIKRTWIKNNISNLKGLHLAMGYFGGRIVNKYIPPEDTQPTNFSLKLHKFTLYSGRYKEKEGENRMIFEGNPTEEARRLGFDLKINNVDSSGVQTITLSNPISFNTEEYMRKHTHTNLGKSFNFN